MTYSGWSQTVGGLDKTVRKWFRLIEHKCSIKKRNQMWKLLSQSW